MISYFTLSKTGGRKINEDAVGTKQADDCIFCVLADGLGGHNAGEVASNLAVEKSISVFNESKDLLDTGISMSDILTNCMMESQLAILEEQKKQNRIDEMKTTAVMLLIEKNTAQWAHVGDSRLYRFFNNEVAERTLDHSVPQMLVLQGEITEKQIRRHVDRNRLTRAMGTEWDTPKFSLSETSEAPPMTSFLLCTDGFWELIEEKDMCRCLKKAKTPENWLLDMEKIVLKNGRRKNMDNYSAVAVFIRDN